MKLIRGRFNYREIGISAITILSIGVAYFNVFQPRMAQELSRLESENKKLVADIDQSKKILAAADAATRVPASSSAPIQKYLAKNNNFGDLIKGLSGDELAFVVDKLSLDKQEAKPGYSKNQFTLEIDTSFLKLGQFVEALEQSDFLLELTTIEVGRITQELKRCTAKIQLNGYVTREAL